MALDAGAYDRDDFAQSAALAICQRKLNPLDHPKRVAQLRNWRRLDDRRREARREAKEIWATSGMERQSRETDPVARSIIAEEVEMLSLAIRQLPIKYRQAIVVRDLRVMPLADAARELRVNTSTLQTRHQRARKAIAGMLAVLVAKDT